MNTVNPSAARIETEKPAYIHADRCWPLVTKGSPCESACPLEMDVPNYVMAISQGRFDQASVIIRETNPLPSVCGRVCHHPCEEECNRRLVDSPIAVKWLKRFIADYVKGQEPSPVLRTRERVAIIGSGPAGLTAAHDLVKKGYGAIIFESSSKPGGILTSAIPEFILPSEVVQADIDYIKALGVQIHTGTHFGQDFSLSDLWRQEFKAVLIATGAQRSIELKIPGSELPGVFSALPWLTAVKAGEVRSLSGNAWVIGGGAVALDVARTALRLGADEVNVACLESRRDMPAYPWEIEAAEREGVRIHPSLAPQALVSQKGFRVDGIKFKRVRTTYLDSEGGIHWTLEEGPGTEYSVGVDRVFIAIGQVPDKSGLAEEGFGIGRRDGIGINEHTLETNIRGVFAAGDVSVTGGTVTESMAAGRKAASSVDHYLRGTTPERQIEPQEAMTFEPDQIPEYLIRKERWEMPSLNSKQATRSFREVELGYEEWQAVEEASRCLNCRMCANCIFDRGQMCYETAVRLL
jgi:NADPH-dependent glutamate synthase beta subunit-like oxidoreductase